jgi:hypothetical protein
MRGLKSPEPVLSTAELVPLLGRARTTIQQVARREGIGRRGPNRQHLFTPDDVERLRERLRPIRTRQHQAQALFE